MSTPERDPKDAIEEFFQNRLSGPQLLRSFAGYSHWIVPATLSAGQPALLEFGPIGSQRRLFMFSDAQAYDACRSALGADVFGDLYLELTGDGVWLSFNDTVEQVHIDPLSPQEIHYKREQFPTLRHWGAIIRVERVLDNVLATDAGYDVIREFEEYFIVTTQSESGPQLMLAPDSKGRKLAAVFTAEDTLEAYLNEMNQRGLEPVKLRGSRLFEVLSRTSLDGFVFNCCGPIAPRAFAPRFAERVNAIK